jgi:hypothetical protein
MSTYRKYSLNQIINREVIVGIKFNWTWIRYVKVKIRISWYTQRSTLLS